MKRAIKVLQLAPLGSGGITSLILNINEQLDKNQVVFDYLTFYERKELREDQALQYGGKKYVVPIDRFDNIILRAAFKFFYSIKVIHQCNPDIIHINASSPYDMMVAVSAKIAGVKRIVIHSHNSSMKKVSGIRMAFMEICKYTIPLISDCNLACSELAARHMFPGYILKKGTYTILPNGIDTRKYCFCMEVRQAWRKKLCLDNPFVIGHVGRFCKAKNHRKLIEIFEFVHRQCPDAVLLLIGIGELQEEIRQIVRKKALADAVIFYGATNEVPALLQVMDCFVLPSLYEGLPVAAVEAQAAGLPTLLSNTITREVGITSLAQFLPLEAAPQEWARQILEIKEQKKLRRNTSEEIRRAGFDIQTVTSQLVQRYVSLFPDEYQETHGKKSGKKKGR